MNPQKRAQLRRTERARKRRATWTGVTAPYRFPINWLFATQFEAVKKAGAFIGAGFMVHRFHGYEFTVQTTKPDKSRGDWIVTALVELSRLREFEQAFGFPQTLSFPKALPGWAVANNLTLIEAFQMWQRETDITITPDEIKWT